MKSRARTHSHTHTHTQTHARMHTKEAGRHFVQQPPTQCGGVARCALLCSVCIGKYMCGPVVVCVCKGIMAHNDCNVKLSQLFL